MDIHPVPQAAFSYKWTIRCLPRAKINVFQCGTNLGIQNGSWSEQNVLKKTWCKSYCQSCSDTRVEMRPKTSNIKRKVNLLVKSTICGICMEKMCFLKSFTTILLNFQVGNLQSQSWWEVIIWKQRSRSRIRVIIAWKRPMTYDHLNFLPLIFWSWFPNHPKEIPKRKMLNEETLLSTHILSVDYIALYSCLCLATVCLPSSFGTPDFSVSISQRCC